jgi:predicted transcriptional regulator
MVDFLRCEVHVLGYNENFGDSFSRRWNDVNVEKKKRTKIRNLPLSLLYI